MLKKIVSVLLLYCMALHLFADEKKEAALDPTLPWLTGPLLTPPGHVVPVGFFDIEPYVFATKTSGVFNRNWDSKHIPHFWDTNLQIPFYIGVATWMDVLINPQGFYNYNHGAHAIRFGDLPVLLDFQLYMDQKETWYPAVKFSVQQNFPTGKYDHLNPAKKGTDAVGSGQWATSPGIVFARVFHFGGFHFLSTRFSFAYTFVPSLNVRGLNSYGGDPSTKGKVSPGNTFTMLFGFEYTLTKNWALALDIDNSYTSKTSFKGKTRLPVGNGSSAQFSLAPAIEYNFNASIGLIAGVWWTLTGRNTSDFTSAVIALNYYGPWSQHKHKNTKFHSHGGKGGRGASGGR